MNAFTMEGAGDLHTHDRLDAYAQSERVLLLKIVMFHRLARTAHHSWESRKWGQKDKHRLTAKGDLTGFIDRLKSEAARVAAVTKANERRPSVGHSARGFGHR